MGFSFKPDIFLNSIFMPFKTFYAKQISCHKQSQLECVFIKH